MDLTQEEKDRIVAEERCRFEAKRQLDLEHASFGEGFRRDGFWRGFLLAIVLSAFVALVMCYRPCRFDRGYGHGFSKGGPGWHQQGNWAPERPNRNSRDCR